MAVGNKDTGLRINQKWICPKTCQLGSRVENIQIKDAPVAYVAIPIEADVIELEDFNHLDELIIYFVAFLRKMRRQFSKSTY